MDSLSFFMCHYINCAIFLFWKPSSAFGYLPEIPIRLHKEAVCLIDFDLTISEKNKRFRIWHFYPVYTGISLSPLIYSNSNGCSCFRNMKPTKLLRKKSGCGNHLWDFYLPVFTLGKVCSRDQRANCYCTVALHF